MGMPTDYAGAYGYVGGSMSVPGTNF